MEIVVYEWFAQAEAAEQRAAALQRAALHRHRVLQGTDLRTRLLAPLLRLADRVRDSQAARYVAAMPSATVPSAAPPRSSGRPRPA